MSKILCCIAAVLMINCGQYTTLAQVLPKDGDTLNYRLIGFSFPEHKKATEYLLEVYEYSPDADVDIFIKDEPVLAKTITRNRVIETVPAFGKQYKWQVKYLRKGKIIDSAGYYYFSVGTGLFTDTSKHRLRVLTNNTGNKDLLIFIDGTAQLYDTDGNALWYLPLIPGVIDTNAYKRVRDLKLTTQRTLTFLTDKNAYEIDYNGNLLWTAPNTGEISGDSTEQYHHEFTRLANGNYMVAGIAKTTKKIPDITDTSIYIHEVDITKNNNEYYKTIYAGTLIEYDTAKNIVWHWKTTDHFTPDDFFTKKKPNGAVNTSTHMNSFYFNIEDKLIYIGYRDINRIVKINYPGGEVLAQYGEDYTKNNRIISTDFFKSHHHNSLTSDGQIILYNNNVVVRNQGIEDKNSISSIVILREPIAGKKEMQKTWEFYCDFDRSIKNQTLTGGSVYELINKNLLVSMGSVNKHFIVTRDKKIIWNAVAETRIGNGAWGPHGTYRNSPIQIKDNLESLIYRQ